MGEFFWITRSGRKRSSRNENFQVVVQSPYKDMENNTHKVLALKYRPANFSQLIGQPILVRSE